MTQTIYRKIIQNTPSELLEEVKQNIKKHKDIRGSKEYLSDVLAFGQSFDPFISLRNIHLHKIQYNLDPKKLQEKDRKKGKVNIPIAKTTQGRELVNMALFLRNDLDEDYIIGFPAFRKIANSFGFSSIEDVTPHKTYAEVEAHKKNASNEAEKEFATTVSQIKKDPSLINTVQSIVERRQVQQLLDLDAEKEKALTYINDLLLSQRNKTDSYDYLFSLRGGLFSQLKQQENTLPPILLNYLYELTDKNTELPVNEHIYKTNVLRAYVSLHQPIKTSIAIGDYIDDIEYINSLEDNNKLKKYFSTESLTDIADLISSETTTLANAGRVLRKTNIQNARSEMTKNYLSNNPKLKKDLDEILKDTKELFLKNNQWLNASTSVPIKHIKDSEKSETLRILSRDDYKAIMERHRGEYSSKSIDELIQSQNITANIDEINNIVVAKRKLNIYNDDKYAPNLKTEDAMIRMAPWRKGKFSPTEYASEEFQMEFAEIMNRLEDQKEEFKFFNLDTRDIYKAAENKLYSREFAERINKSLDKIKDLVSYNNEIKELNEEAKKVNNHHLVMKPNSGHYSSNKDFKYLSSAIVNRIKSTAEVKESLEVLEGIVDASKIEEAKKQYRELTTTHRNWKWNSKVYNGQFEEGILNAQWSKFDESKGEYRATENNIEYINNPQVFVDTIMQFIPVSEDLIEKAQHLTSFKAKPKYKNAGIKQIDGKTWGAFQKATTNDFIDKDLAKSIEVLYDKIQG